MKPIHLSLAGLQSYREKQEIDFTRLCDAGVFGIFGPTGSGKSSILDAMTLALFGKVERASNGTQGILNHAEKALAVSFEFELTNAGGPQRYRVERQFKRSADNSVAGTVCRLIERAEDGSVVLADKAGDVNARIQELLGLSMQDFTRAVVLPQGKFAEFLSLKGSDRRQMLQRLFHLETYGDRLNARLSQRYKKADSALKQTAARLEGMGDASHAAVKTAEESLLAADARSLAMRSKRLEAEQAWEKLRQVLAWQQELAGLSQLQAGQDALQPVMAERESRLKKADRASRIRPYLDEWEAKNCCARNGRRPSGWRARRNKLSRLPSRSSLRMTPPCRLSLSS
jgi:exonuclease SbcC